MRKNSPDATPCNQRESAVVPPPSPRQAFPRPGLSPSSPRPTVFPAQVNVSPPRAAILPTHKKSPTFLTSAAALTPPASPIIFKSRTTRTP